jgi:hypothetical protein
MTPREWLQACSEAWEGGQEDHCAFGHEDHERRYCPTLRWGDWEAFRWEKYDTGKPGWCNGKDELSKSLDLNGIWELPGTTIVERWLAAGDPNEVVLDFGSHIGWYSVLAATWGYEALAVDTSSEHLELLANNACKRGVRVESCRGWIDGDTSPAPPPPDGLHVRLFKSDLEGNDAHAVRICRDLFAQNLIDAALIEISPTFERRNIGDTNYAGLLTGLMSCGYRVAEIPLNLPGSDFELIWLDDPLGRLGEIEQADWWFQLEEI